MVIYKIESTIYYQIIVKIAEVFPSYLNHKVIIYNVQQFEFFDITTTFIILYYQSCSVIKNNWLYY